MRALLGILPLLVVAAGAFLVMMVDAFGGRARAGRVPAEGQSSTEDVHADASRLLRLSWVTAAVLVAGALSVAKVASVGVAQPLAEGLAPHLVADGFSLFLSAIVCLAGALTVLLAGAYFREHGILRSEYFPLFLLSIVGALALVASGDLLTLYVALEILSLGTYCLVGFRRTPRSFEGALKYFMLGGFASALLLFGAAFTYGATGHTDLVGIGRALQSPTGLLSRPLMLGGVILLLGGMSFKVAAVPFHAWTPDAYEGAPTPSSAFMAGIVKVAAFGMLVRVLLTAFGGGEMVGWAGGWPPVLAVLSVLTMSVANLIAVRQASVKRMLAYSSVSHAGYLLLGVLATLDSKAALSSVAFYLLAYSLSTIGAFGTLILAGSKGCETTSYDDLAGLGRRHPAAALLFSIFVLSLAGVPPMAGFFGKLGIFRAGMEAGLSTLVVIALVNSVVAAFYYLRVVVAMYMREPDPDVQGAVPMQSPLVVAVLVITAVLVLALGIAPERVVGLANLAFLGR